METIIIGPAWFTTFPHRVAPQPDEWLPGLLLRCDVANDWDSKTSISHLFGTMPGKSLSNDSKLIVAPGWMLESLASALALPAKSIFSTTYQSELMRLYNTNAPHWKQLNAAFKFRLCPECIAQNQLLKRTLTLPHLKCCPLHHIALLETCQCGRSLSFFSQGTRPFVCPQCSLPWAYLPRLAVSSERIVLEQELLSLFEFFFDHGTPELVARALQLVRSTMSKKNLSSIICLEGGVRYVERYYAQSISLDYLLDLLMSLRFSINDILTFDGALPWWA